MVLSTSKYFINLIFNKSNMIIHILLLFYCFNSIDCSLSKNKNVTLKTHIQNAKFQVNYNQFKINNDLEYIFIFNSTEVSLLKPARITVESITSNRSYPVLVVTRQQKAILSWQLPLIVETEKATYDYNKVSRTLCPDNNYYSQYHLTELHQLIVSVSTSSPKDVFFNMTVTLETNFTIKLNEPTNVRISPTEPKYFLFKFEDDHPTTVLLKVDSNDKICMTVSIQNISCPVFDLERNVEFEGYWQTVDSKGGITLSKNVFPHGFYVVFVAKGDDYDCTANKDPQIISSNRIKNLNFTITSGIGYQEYVVATIVPLCVFALFYVFSFAVFILFLIRSRYLYQNQHQQSLLPAIMDPSNIVDENAASTNSIESPSTPINAITDADQHSLSSDSIDSSLDENDIDMLNDVESEKDIFRTKKIMFVCDLARKNPNILKQKSQLYLWNLLTVAVFYSLPVLQLVITYQKVLNQTGNQDLCYYNFLCAHPFGPFSDLNHIFSNSGYLLLGLLFILITYRKSRYQQKHDTPINKTLGIPQHYGLFYSMGFALMMEGVLSACYHVCPNHTNFQFDTSFMYVIAMMCILKIYQTRHPDINASAYATFGVLALIIFIGMIGVLANSESFLIVFTIIHIITCLILSVQIYYMGRWSIDFKVFIRDFPKFYIDIKSNPLNCLRPMYAKRMILIILGNICNWILAAIGHIYHIGDFATYLLIIFMSNLMLYCLFYIAMKLCHREKILMQPLIYIILSFACWGTSLYFFFNKSISWALTPAQSRYFNQSCKMLDFYDNHDIWHFLSATSMFFSFMILLTLDDDLIFVERNKIHVF